MSTAQTGQAERQGDALHHDRREPKVLGVLALTIVVYVVLAAFIAVRTPSFESADEYGHFDNVQTLVSGHWYRIPTHCWSPQRKPICTSNELHQPPLYYLLLAGWQDVIGIAPVPPPTNFGTAHGAVLGGHYEVLLRHPDRAPVLWLRFPNIVLGVATILLVFAAGRTVTQDRWTPVVAAAVVAFMPRFLFLSPFITNDNLVTLLGAALLWCALGYIRRPSWRWMAATGLVFGLLVTTKLSALPLGLLLPILALAAPSWRRRAWLFTCGILSALTVSSWYLIPNWVRCGDVLARHASTTYLMQIGGLGTFDAPYVVKNPVHLVFLDVPRRFLLNFWYTSGWDQLHWSLSVGIAITCVLEIVLLGLIGRSVGRWVLITLATISVLALSSVWFVAFQTATYQPRYALVGLGAMAVLVALALERWRLPVRWLLPCAGLIGCLLAIHQDVLGIHWT